MEPRPPRPRSQPSREHPPVSSADGHAGPPPPYRPGASPGPDVYPPQAGVPGAYEGPIPLVPRVERQRRRLARTVALLLLLLAVLGGGGYLLRDRILPDDPDTPPAQVALDPAPTPTEVAAAAQETRLPAQPTPAPASGGSVLDPPTATAPAAAPGSPPPANRAAPPPAAAEGGAAAPAAADGEDAPPPADRAPQDLLPTEAQVPSGLVETEEGSLDRDAVLNALGGTEEANDLLDRWGWDANVFRYFATGEGETTENGITDVTISVHQFADPGSAADAVQYFSDYLITTGSGYEVVEGETIGDETRWLRQETDAGINLAAYLRVGPDMVRIGGFSPDADPAADVAAIAQAIAEA